MTPHPARARRRRRPRARPVPAAEPAPVRTEAPPCAVPVGLVGLPALVALVLLGLAATAGQSAAAPFPSADPRWRWPLDQPVQVTRAFEAPAHAYAPGHRGVDLSAALGAPVRAAGAGTVVLAGPVAGRSVVVVAHGEVRGPDELRTTYQPVDPTLAVGSRVAAGAVIGRVGEWTDHCARGARSCLHWGLRRGADYLDPMALLRGPVRLLPLGGPVPAATPVTDPERRTDQLRPNDQFRRTELTRPTESERPSTGAHAATPTDRRAGAPVTLAVAAVLAAATTAAMARSRRPRTRAAAVPTGPRGSLP